VKERKRFAPKKGKLWGEIGFPSFVVDPHSVKHGKNFVGA